MGDDDVSTEAETEGTKETYYEVLAASSVGWNEARVFHFWEIEKHAPGFRRRAFRVRETCFRPLCGKKAGWQEVPFPASRLTRQPESGSANARFRQLLV